MVSLKTEKPMQIVTLTHTYGTKTNEKGEQDVFEKQ